MPNFSSAPQTLQPVESKLDCRYAGVCSGCDWIHLDPQQQMQKKIEHVLELLGSHHSDILEYKGFANHGLRDRLDFTYDKGRRGLFRARDQVLGSELEIVDLQDCLQLSQSLQKFYSEFREIPFPEDMKGSFRLRVSPHGARGVWLDFANADVKALLEEKRTLLELKRIAEVEIGQRHKSLEIKTHGGLGLGEPVFRPWFQTHLKDRIVDLECTIGSFTQPSHVTNAWITKTIAKWMSELKPLHVLEFGSGVGNLTIPALSHDQTRVISLELDPRFARAQEMTLIKQGLRERVDLHVGDFRLRSLSQLPQIEVFLLNPARNGVGDLFQKSFERLKGAYPRDVIYMSCYPKSFALDTQKLQDFGYRARRLILVDQFPQTHHLEILSHWSLEN